VRIEELTEAQIDALTEVGSIGAGHAATALSQLVDKAISLTTPKLEIVPITEVPRVFGSPEQLVGAVYARLLGDIEGGILFMMPRDSSLALIDLMHSREPGTTKSFGHDEEALISHVASILDSSYIAAIARLADLNILPSTPSFALDMAGAILEVAMTEAGMRATSALLVRTTFCDEETSVDAVLFFLPDPDSLETILGRLGMA
jgi:chemotaxis protein CheC